MQDGCEPCSTWDQDDEELVLNILLFEISKDVPGIILSLEFHDKVC